MVRRISLSACCAVALVCCLTQIDSVQAQQAYGRSWGGTYNTQDWNRFYHYPYVYYPQNFWGNEYYRSADSLYHRYPPEMRIPVYNRHWHNYYPTRRKYHAGHHFVLDVF
ncbi:MAG: calmodulin-binding protein [Pirellulales bacterium]|nr:calmodulin-binding protein [Pirellulales bacterium]HCK40362.1 calmodulin-binding protein [Planctomycetaceae bacterium]|tara:strand:- start:523 stop:852 length:330 start_codon:yes stop_codon:yes gene_type:complete